MRMPSLPFRRAFLLPLLALLLPAQQSITFLSIPDISGTGVAVPLASSGTVRACQLVAPSGNASVVRWGDSLISSTRGSKIAAGGGQYVPNNASYTSAPGAGTVFQLNTLYVLVQSGDSLSATCIQ